MTRDEANDLVMPIMAWLIGPDSEHLTDAEIFRVVDMTRALWRDLQALPEPRRIVSAA